MTIRFLAILTISVAIAFLSIPRFAKTILINTGRDLDMAIVGRGNFCLVDTETAELRYTRNGNFVLDANGQLAVGVEGSNWLIDPPVQVPSDWERIAVLHDGRVQTLQAGFWTDVGQLQLAVFTATPTFEDPLAGNLYSDAVGPPTHHTPGDVAGMIQQGWAEQRTTTLSGLTTRILVAILVAGVLSRWVSIHSANWQVSSNRQSLDGMSK